MKQRKDTGNRYLLNIKAPYRLEFDKVIQKLEELGFKTDKVYQRMCFIIGYIESDESLQVIKNLPEIKGIKKEPIEQKIDFDFENCKHNKIYSGNKKGSFPEYVWIWVCSICGQLEFDRPQYTPTCEPELFDIVIQTLLENYKED